jgi:DNA-binding NarL/FixJ family response regulator
MPLIRILLVDDSPEFLDAAVRFVSSDPELTVVGSSLTGLDALEQIRQSNPDLILMDLALPGISGLETTRLIKAQPESPRIIILTLHDNPEYRAASESANADGFLAKSEFGTQLLPLIHSLFEPEPIQKTATVS